MDAQIPPNVDRAKFEDAVKRTAKEMWMQFSAIILSEPEILEPAETTAEGRPFLRVQFRIWPGQGSLIENTFRQRLLTALKTLDPNYADWMLVVTYRSVGLTGKASFAI